MFQKNSLSIPSDSSGILLVKVIQTRKCGIRRHAKAGKFLRIVIRLTKPELIKRRKKKLRAVTIRSKHTVYRNGVSFQFYDNALVLLKRRMNTVGKDLYGSTSKEFKIKKFRVAYRYVF